MASVWGRGGGGEGGGKERFWQLAGGVGAIIFIFICHTVSTKYILL